MLNNPNANDFLYVPFNKEYSAHHSLKKKLTEYEFFTKCYYDPNFDEIIKDIIKEDEESCCDLGYPTSKKELVENISSQKKSRARFLSWIDNDDVGIYAITGDAGTGKSTFLHYLRFIKYGNCIWNFLDLQTAHDSVGLMSYKVSFQNFHLLQQKLASTVIGAIIEKIFVKNSENHTYDYIATKKKILSLLDYYQQKIDELYPFFEISNLFKQIMIVCESLNDKEYCEKCAEQFYAFFDNASKDCLDENNSSSILMELYLIVLNFLSPGKKNIIVFDNLERFIGVDEIFNYQIYSFLTKLRTIHDNYDRTFCDLDGNISLFAKNYQFVVAMRHTTTRMFTPQQNSDFVGHISNISEWFPVDEIISLKSKWFNENEIQKENVDRLLNIISDKGFNGNFVRGLNLKLNALFNNNKRLILDCLFSVLEDESNEKAISKSEEFYKHPHLSKTLSKHAYRTIIWRLIIDKLLTDDIFINDVLYSDSFDFFTSIDYMRKILIILSNYSLEHKYGYMSFEDVLKKLYPDTDMVSDWFCSEGCDVLRKKLYSLLYIMHYYCRRDNNWFQFVDIQCNKDIFDGVHIKNSEDFAELVSDNLLPKDIGIQITTSGKAYLGYVAQTFEFISRAYENNAQLLLSLPTYSDIKNKKIEDLECVKIIFSVIDRAKQLCNEIDGNILIGYDVLYKKNLKSEPNAYSDNIRRSINGSINNFCLCIKKIYPKGDKKFLKQRYKLLKIINKKREELIVDKVV